MFCIKYLDCRHLMTPTEVH